MSADDQLCVHCEDRQCHLHIEKFDDETWFYFSSAFCSKQPLLERLRQCYKMLTNNTVIFEQVLLGKDKVAEIIQFLERKLY